MYNRDTYLLGFEKKEEVFWGDLIPPSFFLKGEIICCKVAWVRYEEYRVTGTLRCQHLSHHNFGEPLYRLQPVFLGHNKQFAPNIVKIIEIEPE